MRISDWSSDVCSSDLRAQVGVLVEALADRQPQLPEGDVIGNLGIADGAEVDGIEAAQRGDAVLGHHAPAATIAVGAPVEVLRLEGEAAIEAGNDIQQIGRASGRERGGRYG